MDRVPSRRASAVIMQMLQPLAGMWGLIKIMGPSGVCMEVYSLELKVPKGALAFKQPACMQDGFSEASKYPNGWVQLPRHSVMLGRPSSRVGNL